MILILRRVAIASGLALAALLLWFRRVEHGNAVSRVATGPVVVANRDIPEGVGIDPIAVVVAQWPVGTVPADAYGSAASVAGRVTRVPIYRGEAIVRGRLAPNGTGPGLEVRITPGKRAYGIRIEEGDIPVGMIQPNSRVDIMVVIDDTGTSKRTAKLFMSNVRVLAIGSAPERAADGHPTNAAVASIEVTPEEAERTAIAASHGSLQLVLRGWADRTSAQPEKPYIPNGLSPDQRIDAMPRYAGPSGSPRPDSVTVRVFRGKARSVFAPDSAARQPRH